MIDFVNARSKSCTLPRVNILNQSSLLCILNTRAVISASVGSMWCFFGLHWGIGTLHEGVVVFGAKYRVLMDQMEYYWLRDSTLLTICRLLCRMQLHRMCFRKYYFKPNTMTVSLKTRCTPRSQTSLVYDVSWGLNRRPGIGVSYWFEKGSICTLRRIVKRTSPALSRIQKYINT